MLPTNPQLGVNMRGQPTKYRPEMCEQAYKLCLLGATNAQLADFFSVNEDSIMAWIKKHKAFGDAVTRGKKIADAEVAQSLYHRAKGYSHEDTQINVVNVKGEPKTVRNTYTKQYAPDVTACIFWLKNRDRENWRDVKQIDGKVKHDHEYTDLELAHELAGIIAKVAETADSEAGEQAKEIVEAVTGTTDRSVKH